MNFSKILQENTFYESQVYKFISFFFNKNMLVLTYSHPKIKKILNIRAFLCFEDKRGFLKLKCIS